MARLGAFCFPGTGHINPMTALARRLEQRGHQVVVFGIADVESRVRAAGIEFHPIGQQDYPLGTLQKLDQRLGELSGLPAFRFTVERIRNTAAMVLRDGPQAARNANLDALLVDEAEMGGNVAEHLGLPFVSIAFFPPLVDNDVIPPFVFHWSSSESAIGRLRNRLGMRLLSRLAAPIFSMVNDQRKTWNLPPIRRTTESLSKLAQITQLPAAVEFPAPNQLPHLHYTGPWVDHRQRPPVDFPWEKLDPNRPLVYASLGTVQNGSETLFRIIAEACAGLSTTSKPQLVLSLGGGLDPARLGTLPGDPIVVRYAPQLDLVKRAAAVITHAGLNTVLETLAEGVPMVALPQGNDQPGVAARIAARGAGIVLRGSKVNATQLRIALHKVLEEESYRTAARQIQTAMQQIDGLDHASNIIEDALNIRIALSNHTFQPRQANVPAPS